MSAERVRGTQSAVAQMGWVFARPSLTALEVAWRWLIGVPLLLVSGPRQQDSCARCRSRPRGLIEVTLQDPWVSAVRMADAWDLYRPPVMHVLAWLAPVAALAWVIVSGLGRSLVLKRLDPRIAFRPAAMIALQAAWLAVLVLTFWGWYRSIGWAAATHIGTGDEPDLVGYSMWAIFLSLGFFTLWGLVNWPVSIAPMLVVLEDRSACLGPPRGGSAGKRNFEASWWRSILSWAS